MGIRFIFGRAGAGKSYYCLNQIKKKLNNDENNKEEVKETSKASTVDPPVKPVKKNKFTSF